MPYTVTSITELRKSTGSVVVSKSFSADSMQSMEFTIANAVTDQQVDLAVTFARMKWLLISSTKAVTIESFDASSAGNVFSLVADNPLVWFVDSPVDNPLDDGVLTKITKLLVTNASGATATINIEVGYDPTP